MTDELVDLSGSDDELAAAILDIETREQQLADAKRAIKQELASRMAANDQRVVTTPGGLIVQLNTGRHRVWDPDDLEQVVIELHDRGTIQAAQYTGLIRHQLTVNGTIALRLLKQTTGDARAQLENCYTWQEDTPRLTVARAPTEEPNDPARQADMPVQRGAHDRP